MNDAKEAINSSGYDESGTGYGDQKLGEIADDIMDVIWPNRFVSQEESKKYVFPVNVRFDNGTERPMEADPAAYWNRPIWGNGSETGSYVHPTVRGQELEEGGDKMSIEARNYYREYIKSSINQIILCISLNAAERINFRYGELVHNPEFVAQGDERATIQGADERIEELGDVQRIIPKSDRVQEDTDRENQEWMFETE